MPIDLTDFIGPTAARDAIEKAGCVMLAGRNSGHGGRRPRQAAVQDLLEAVAEFERHTGLSISGLFPAAAELENMLKVAPPTSFNDSDGKPFTISFVQLHWPDHGVHCLLAAGSGRKVDSDALQPVLVREAEMFRSVRPGLLFSKRIDRLGRKLWGFGELMSLVEADGAWMGDETGLHRSDEANRLRVFLDAGRGEQAADKMPKQTRRGMASRTASTMVDGRVAYHVAHAPPPGLVRLGMLGVGNSRGDTLLVLDAPAYLPAPSQVATGMPRVLTTSGEHVDQVENVRWVLSVLGRPEWSNRRVVEELARRSMSTAALRLSRGADATLAPPDRTTGSYPILVSIKNNLELYRTGRLIRRLGVEGVEDVVIEDVLPTDGPWATPEDFDRIDAMMARTGEGALGRRSLCLSSLPALLNGDSARLISSAQRRRQGPPGYVVRHTGGLKPGHKPRAEREPIIPHDALAESIVEAIAAAGHVPLLPQSTDPPEDRDLASKVTRQEARVAQLTAECGALVARLTQTDSEGRFVLGEALIAALNARYQELHDTEIPEAELQLQQAKMELEDRRVARGRMAAAGRSDDLLRLLASLRDPHDLTWSGLWLSAIANFEVETELVRRAGHTTDICRWHGKIVFSELSDRWAIPFAGEHRAGSGTRVSDRVDRLVDELLSGHAFEETSIQRSASLKCELAARFGVAGRTFLLGSCRDPRIIRAASRILLDRSMSDEDAAAELGEEVAFVRRIRSVYLDDGRRSAVWLLRDQLQLAAWHVLASNSGGVVTLSDMSGYSSSRKAALSALMNSTQSGQWTRLGQRQGYRLESCRFCGSLRRAPMRIPEPVGLVCLDCRRDEMGLCWPADPYDGWRCGADLWAATGGRR